VSYVAVFTKETQKIAEDLLYHTLSFIYITFCFYSSCIETCSDKRESLILPYKKMPFVEGC